MEKYDFFNHNTLVPFSDMDTDILDAPKLYYHAPAKRNSFVKLEVSEYSAKGNWKVIDDCLKGFVSKDLTREAMTRLHIGQNHVYATDAHRVAALYFFENSYKRDKLLQVEIGSENDKDVRTAPDDLKLDIEGIVFGFEVYETLKIKLYLLKSIVNTASLFMNDGTNRIAFTYTINGKLREIWVNAKYIADAINFFEKHGLSEVYISVHKDDNRPFIIHQREDYLSGSFIFQMPIMLHYA